jgi:hypothetical protein
MRFLGLSFEDTVPDAKTIWLFRELLVEAGAVQKLFDPFDEWLTEKGYLAMGGQVHRSAINLPGRSRTGANGRHRQDRTDVPKSCRANPAVRLPDWVDAVEKRKLRR